MLRNEISTCANSPSGSNDWHKILPWGNAATTSKKDTCAIPRAGTLFFMCFEMTASKSSAFFTKAWMSFGICDAGDPLSGVSPGIHCLVNQPRDVKHRAMKIALARGIKTSILRSFLGKQPGRPARSQGCGKPEPRRCTRAIRSCGAFPRAISFFPCPISSCWSSPSSPRLAC